MGLPSRFALHARYRDGTDRRNDRREAQDQQHGGRRRPASGLIAAFLGLALAGPSIADTVRVATWNAGLDREGPGLLLRDILEGSDPQVVAAVQVLAETKPDVLLLTGFDYDVDLAALHAFAERVAEAGVDYPVLFALRPNTGRMTDLDLDQDGRTGGPGDAQGWGRFSGEGGMAVLSKLPIDTEQVRDFSGFLWADLPGVLLGDMPDEHRSVRLLSTTGHWDVPILLPGGSTMHLLAWYAAPPVFGRGDENARRNHDEAAFWTRLLDGGLPYLPPRGPFVLLGDANLDPFDGDGRPHAIKALLSDPRLVDPKPRSDGAANSPTLGQAGDPGLDTADWPEPGDSPSGPGNLRVDYVLPSADLHIRGAGVWWPAEGQAARDAMTASPHRLVWVDIDLP